MGWSGVFFFYQTPPAYGHWPHSPDFVPPMPLWVSPGGTGRQLQLWQSVPETFLAEGDYRLGEGGSAAPQPALLRSACMEKIRIIYHPADKLQAPSMAPSAQSLHRPPQRLHRVVPPCDTRTRDTHTSAAAYCLLHKKSASLRQDGAVQNYLVTSQKLLQSLVSTALLYVQLRTPTLARVPLPVHAGGVQQRRWHPGEG